MEKVFVSGFICKNFTARKNQTHGERNDNLLVTARPVLIAAVPKITESRFCGACLHKYAIRPGGIAGRQNDDGAAIIAAAAERCWSGHHRRAGSADGGRAG